MSDKINETGLPDTSVKDIKTADELPPVSTEGVSTKNIKTANELPLTSTEGTSVEITENIGTGHTIKTFTEPVFWSSSMLFLISCLVFILLAASIRQNKYSAYELLITFGIPFIVLCSVFAVIIAPDREAVMPIVGLLGTIAGYLLGRNDSFKK